MQGAEPQFQRLLGRLAVECKCDDDLRKQLLTATVATETWDGSGSGGHVQFLRRAADPVRYSEVRFSSRDTDNMPIQIILHFVKGNLDWGEWFRVDGVRISRWPPLEAKWGNAEL